MQVLFIYIRAVCIQSNTQHSSGRHILVNVFLTELNSFPTKMSRGTNSILSEIEWDEGLSMPVANVENKAMEDQVHIMHGYEPVYDY